MVGQRQLRENVHSQEDCQLGRIRLDLKGQTLGEPGLSATPLAGTLLRETRDYLLRNGERVNALPVGTRSERGNHPREDLSTEQDHGGTTGSPKRRETQGDGGVIVPKRLP
jgi:hypothetical protein